MKSYGQACGLARALDLVGDRWSMLIVRELMIRGACRYTDLRAGLPGVATNLLADRVRELEALGIVTREAAPPPVAATLFSLTERGQALEPALLALGQWGAMTFDGEAEGDMQDHWIVLPLRLMLRDRDPTAGPKTIDLRCPDARIAVAVTGGKVEVTLAVTPQPNATVVGGGRAILNLMSGRAPLVGTAVSTLKISGDLSALRRVIPTRVPA